MKNTLFTLFLFLVVYSGYSQGDDYYGNYQNYYEQSEIIENPTIQPPEVAAFQKVNFIPVNNYTGRVEVKIPIYTIKSGNISVPITLSYNTGGVKVNDIPSSVGSNWSLNAGGVVSKIVKGMDDFQKYRFQDTNYELEPFPVIPSGWLYRKYNPPTVSWSSQIVSYPQQNDPLPDLFIVSAPGLSTQYTHTVATDASPTGQLGSGGDIFELTGQKNMISETIGEFNTLGWFKNSQGVSGTNDYEYIDGQFISGLTLNQINTININTLSGVEYSFSDVDVSQYSYSEKKRKYAGGWEPTEIITNFKAESYNLTYIKDKKTNRQVNFEYEKYYISGYDPIDDSYFYYGATDPFDLDALIDAKSVKYTQLNRLKKITFDKGSVEFVYGLNRLDVIGEKALTTIIIKDLNGTVVKNINLNYSYFQSPYFTSTPQSKRLRLDRVYESGSSGNSLPAYKLTYNATSLPARGTWGQDFLGYNNGTYSSTNTNPKPEIYFYPDNGVNSLLPVSKGAGYYLLAGNYSLASNLAYAKAGILEKIEYPTGGFSEFEYELNKFKLDNASITGGGLRIKSQKIIDENNNEQILDYQYIDSNNETSGSIVSFSNYVDLKVKNGYTPPLNTSSTLNYFSFKTYRLSQAQAELTKGSFVGYSRVVVKDRVNNGFTEYNYTAPKDAPNELANRSNGSILQQHAGIIETAIRNGVNNYSKNNEIKRGNLVSKSIFDKSNTLLFNEVNNYQYKVFNSIDFINKNQLSNDNIYYTGRGEYTGPEMVENISIVSERNVLTQNTTTHYLDGGATSVVKQTTYDPEYPLITENSVIDGQKTVVNKYYYPHNSAVSSMPNISSLRTQNRYAEMIKQETFSDNLKIYSEVINYNNFGNNMILPKSVSTSKGIYALEENAVIDKRDAYGNIIQYHTKDGVYTSFIYGYNYNTLLAKVENATYDTVVSLLPVSMAQLQGLNRKEDENTLLNYFKSLRNGLPSAKVTSYTYIPSVGISTITDTKGYTQTYFYDEFNRLTLIKDADKNIVKRVVYKYKNQ